MKKLNHILALTILAIFFSVSLAGAASLFNYPKFKGATSTGAPLSGGKLYTYAPGTSTPKATYADKAKAVANANPVVLDSNGEATIYLDGYYKMILKNSAGVTQWTMDNVSGIGSSVVDYVTIGDYSGDLAAAVMAIGSTPTTLIINSATTCTTNVTIPSTLHIRAEKAGVITISSGKTLTINGPFEAGLYQVFSGSGTVAGLKEARPEWFGADSSGVTSSHTAFQKAVTASKNVIATGKYLFTDVVTVATANTYVYGGGEILYPSDGSWTGSTTREFFQVTADSVRFDGLIFNGQNGTIGHVDWWGVRFTTGGTKGQVINCIFKNMAKQTGAHSGAPLAFETSSPIDGQVTGCKFISTHGGVFTQASRTVINGNTFNTIGDVAIALNGSSQVASVVTGNLVENTGDYAAIAVEEGPSHWTISGNTIRNCGIAFYMYNSVYTTAVSGGTFVGNDISISPGFSGAASPILLSVNAKYTKTVISGNKIFYDTTGLTLSGTGWAMYINGSADHKIEGNTFEAVTGPPTMIGFVGTGAAEINNNRFILNNSSSSAIQFSATHIGRVDLIDNFIEDPVDYGVLWTGGHTWTGIIRNTRWNTMTGTRYYQNSPWGNIGIGDVTHVQPGGDHTLSNIAEVRSTIVSGNTSVAPASGTWKADDFVWNANTGVGRAIGWQCTAAGTPGTWIAAGQVGYRSGAGDPTASVTPYFAGEMYLNTTGNHWYRSHGTANTDWTALN